MTRSHTLSRPISTGGAIGQVAAALLASVDPGRGHPAARGECFRAHEAAVDQLSFDLGDGMTEANQSATATEQSWHDVTVAVDAIRDRFGKTSVGSAGHVSEDGVQCRPVRDAPWGPDE